MAIQVVPRSFVTDGETPCKFSTWSVRVANPDLNAGLLESGSDRAGSTRAQMGRREAMVALAGMFVACTGENEQFSLPPELTERGAFVAALEPGYGYRLNRILDAERFPQIEETLLHLII